MSDRRDGWYHIKVRGIWTLGYFQSEHGWRQHPMAGQDFLPMDMPPQDVGHRVPAPDEEWVCVPSNGSTPAMDNACRAFLMLLPSTTYKDARNHIKLYSGEEALSSWPAWTMEADGHIPKGAQADLIFRMMTSAAPSPDGTR